MNLVTIERADQKFLQYLKGTFSKDHRAIPVYSNSPTLNQKEVVFEVMPLGDLSRPSTVMVWLKTLRGSYLTFSLGPIFAALALALWKSWEVNLFLAFSSAMGVLAFQIAAHFLNDYFDHVNGVDHVIWRGSQAIQKGWIAAYSLQRAGIFSLVVAVLCGLPALVEYPQFILIAGFLAFLGVVKFSSVSFKSYGLGEFALFVLTGPALFSGFTWAFSGKWDWDVLFLGSVFGAMSSVVYFLKNIEEMIVDDSSHANSLARRIGFDASKKWARLILFLLPMSFCLWSLLGQGQVWFVIGAFLFAPVIWLSRELKNTESCLSSKVTQVRQKGIQLHMAFGVLVTLALVSWSLF